MVSVGVGGDLLSCLVQGFPLQSPRQALVELPESGLDEHLRLKDRGSRHADG
jgi:hypothetical protein